MTQRLMAPSFRLQLLLLNGSLWRHCTDIDTALYMMSPLQIIVTTLCFICSDKLVLLSHLFLLHLSFLQMGNLGKKISDFLFHSSSNLISFEEKGMKTSNITYKII